MRVESDGRSITPGGMPTTTVSPVRMPMPPGIDQRIAFPPMSCAAGPGAVEP